MQSCRSKWLTRRYPARTVGNVKVADSLVWKGGDAFANRSLEPYNVDGKQGGLFKTQDNLSWIQVFEAGHMIPYDQPALALQAFRQVMSGSGVRST